MDIILLSFAFLAGMQAFFAPCSIALIPAYVGYYVNDKHQTTSKMQHLLFGLRAGSFASLGLLSVYIILGIVLTILGKIISPFVPWVELITGGVLLFLGTAVLLGYEFALRPPVVFQTQTNGAKRFYLFGVAYACGAVGCTLPIFILVILQALTQRGILGGFMNFIAYGVAMTLLMLSFSMIAAVSKATMQSFLHKYMEKIQKFAGVLILGAGAYTLYLAMQVLVL